MGTHPIFESDFDCLTEIECALGRTGVIYQNGFALGSVGWAQA